MTNDLTLATKIADELEDKGVDALVYDTVRKKGSQVPFPDSSTVTPNKIN